MGKIILLIIVAAWGAVLVPPLLRGRQDSRPGSSVMDFRRQLNTLQRSDSLRHGSPMRSMSRPLAPSPGIAQRGQRVQHGYATSDRHRISRQSMLRQRRQNVLVSLGLVTMGSAFIAFTTKSDFFIYTFVLSAMSLAGYCYKLSQMRQYPNSQRSNRRGWVRAA